MSLRQKTLKSQKNSADIFFPDVGDPLKIYPLKKWIYENKLTMSDVAEVMELSPADFKSRLKIKEKFYERELRELVYFMGAENAFNVICFPTKSIRRKVRRQVFGRNAREKIID